MPCLHQLRGPHQKVPAHDLQKMLQRTGQPDRLPENALNTIWPIHKSEN